MILQNVVSSRSYERQKKGDAMHRMHLSIAVLAATILSPGVVLAASDEGGAKMPQLDPSTFGSQLFWLGVTFAVLFLLMWKIALPRVGEVIDAREQKIRTDLERAESLKSEVAEVEAEIDRILADARSDAQESLRKASDKISADIAKKQESLDASIAKQIAEAEERVAADRKAALENVRQVAIDVATATVEKLTGETPDAKSVGAAVDQASKEA